MSIEHDLICLIGTSAKITDFELREKLLFSSAESPTSTGRTQKEQFNSLEDFPNSANYRQNGEGQIRQAREKGEEGEAQ